jgi:hypothetical protein
MAIAETPSRYSFLFSSSNEHWPLIFSSCGGQSRPYIRHEKPKMSNTAFASAWLLPLFRAVDGLNRHKNKTRNFLLSPVCHCKAVLHEQQKASKIHRIGAQKRGSAITDPTQWLIRANKWLEMLWWHFQLSKNPPSWPFNGQIAR